MELSFSLESLEVVAEEWERSVFVEVFDLGDGAGGVGGWGAEHSGSVGVVEHPRCFFAVVEELLPVVLVEFVEVVQCFLCVLSLCELVRCCRAKGWCEHDVDVERDAACLEDRCLFLCECLCLVGDVVDEGFVGFEACVLG